MMAQESTPTEIEARFMGIDPEAMRLRLASQGYQLHTPDRLMRRVRFHSARDPHGKTEAWRVRDEGHGRVTAAWKKTDQNSVDGTREIEISITGDGYNAAVELLKTTGLIPVAYQESCRETWRQGDVEVVIDVWPGLRPFVEIEAPIKQKVIDAATALGFNMSDAVFGDVSVVYQHELGHSPDVMRNWPSLTFTNPPS
jgi:predicted adenylyl cyclase CyaB